MVKRFNIEEAVDMNYKNSFKSVIRPVCPDCICHEQKDTTEVRDCKNLFIDDAGKTVGQCCCYSAYHGVVEG